MVRSASPEEHDAPPNKHLPGCGLPSPRQALPQVGRRVSSVVSNRRRLTLSSVRWIRHRYGITGHRFEQSGEMTVKDLAELLGVSRNVVY